MPLSKYPPKQRRAIAASMSAKKGEKSKPRPKSARPKGGRR